MKKILHIIYLYYRWYRLQFNTRKNEKDNPELTKEAIEEWNHQKKQREEKGFIKRLLYITKEKTEITVKKGNKEIRYNSKTKKLIYTFNSRYNNYYKELCIVDTLRGIVLEASPHINYANIIQMLKPRRRHWLLTL